MGDVSGLGITDGGEIKLPPTQDEGDTSDTQTTQTEGDTSDTQTTQTEGDTSDTQTTQTEGDTSDTQSAQAGENPKVTEPVPLDQEETESGSLQPFITYAKENPTMFCLLGVTILLLLLLLVSGLRKKSADRKGNRKKGSKEESNLTNVTGVGADDNPSEKGIHSSTGTESIPPGEKFSVPVKTGVLHCLGSREDQQDSYGMSEYENEEKGMVAVVADGMGGLSNGKAVSSLIVNTCLDVFRSLPDYVSRRDMLLQMAIQSNNAVNQMLKAKGKSGSTMVAAAVRKGQLHFLTVGDSRIYLYRGGVLIQLNREHIYQEELALQALDQRVSIHQVNTDPQVGALTSYLGIGRIPHLDRNRDAIKLIDKDKIILASDGVFGTLTQDQMEAALKLPATQAAQKLARMVEDIHKPYQDNYTAVVLEYHI